MPSKEGFRPSADAKPLLRTPSQLKNEGGSCSGGSSGSCGACAGNSCACGTGGGECGVAPAQPEESDQR